MSPIPNLMKVISVERVLRSTPPKGWRALKEGVLVDRVVAYERLDIVVIESIDKMNDGQRWHHLSVSRHDKLPTWKELRRVRDAFLGEETEAIHAIPNKADYVNVHKYCMHVWALVETPGDDFEERLAQLYDEMDRVAAARKELRRQKRLRDQ